MAIKISDHAQWVGKTDWQLTSFHGDELSTHHGSSYNSYLVRDKKTVLIDTVWLPFDKEFVSRLREQIDLKEIDYIVMNHNEVDHSGALPELMREIPDVPIYCTKRGEAIIRGHYHQDWNFVNVKTGDTLPLGETTLTFIEAPMLHWPDTMMSYLSGDKVLFSNDCFGQHYASASLFDDTADLNEVFTEAEKYYANILQPFSPLVARKLKELDGLNLPIDVIAPSHGIIWRDDVSSIVECYRKWSAAYQENVVTILYDTMWNSTRVMAESIADGIREADPSTEVRLFNVAYHDKNDIVTAVFRSKAVLTGCPTINQGYSFAMGGIIEMLKGMKFRGKHGAAFGSYGWSGEAVERMGKDLAEAGFNVAGKGLRLLWVPDDEAVAACRKFGEDFAKALQADASAHQTN
ncbi:MAG: MBL fold metallo-hydrolase [Muribaculaceae bacterium]|nr:MBL fold metallo-hydrolase [Muribaculaceae bacterium]